MSFKSTFSAAKWTKIINDRTKKRMGIAVEVAKADMLKDIEQGKGGDKNFKPYSPAYAEYKKQKLGRTTVNLRETGQMLKAMQSNSEIVQDGVLGKIFFLASEKEKAIWNKKLRPNFFELSKKQLQTIVKRLRGQ